MKILLDTAFLLPSFGVKVQGIDEDRLIALLKNLRESGVEFAYPKLLLVELIAKIGKEALRKGELPPEALEALEALLLEVDVELVEPNVKHIVTATEMRIRGHDDIFDNLLYATALHEDMKLVTEDDKLVKFLKDKGYRADFVLRFKDLEDVLAIKR
jgi:predicted nucleic acid-binding protein